ncbi:MAG: hypothetical protein ABI863_06585 [Ginsengibacter sp.]
MIRNIPPIVLMFFSTISFAQDEIAKSSWVTSPVKIDGKPQEWKLPLRYYDAGTKLFFAFANDDKNLYLCFQAPDEMSQVKIMRAGMEVYLSVKGKHKVSVSFPLAQQSVPTPLQNDNNSQPGQELKNRRTSFILQNTLMEVKGFETKNGFIPINDSSGINAAINWDENDKLTYEMSIPLKEWFGINFTAPDMSKDITLDIEINAVKWRGHTGSGGGSNGFSGRGRSGGAGGMPHGRNTNTDEENSALPGENKYLLFQKSKLKEKFILAQDDSRK